MSVHPPPNPLDYRPPPPARRRARVGTVIAWGVILACVAATITREQWSPKFRRAAAAARPATQPALTPVEDVKSTQLQIAARYVVAVRGLMPADQQKEVTPQLVKQIEQASTASAGNPIDEFRGIPVLAELEGGPAALARLDEFEKRHVIVRLRPDVDALRTLYADGPDKLTDAQRAALVARHGWFGQLAVAYGAAADDPRRTAAMRPATTTLLAVGGASAGGLLALVGGVVLSILAAVRLSQGRLARRYRPAGEADPSAGPFAEAFAVYLAAFMGLSLALGLLFPDAGLWAQWVATIVIPLAAGWLRVRGVPWLHVRGGLGWHAGGRGATGVLREVGAGLVGYVAGLPVLAVGMLVTIVLINVTHAHPTHPIQDMPMNTGLERLQVLLLAAVWAPVIEETMFRGALFHHLRARFGWWASTIVVSVVFAVIHPQGWTTVPALAAVAIVLAGIREWRGSIVGPMAAHALHNAVLVTVTLIGAS